MNTPRSGMNRQELWKCFPDPINAADKRKTCEILKDIVEKILDKQGDSKAGFHDPETKEAVCSAIEESLERIPASLKGICDKEKVFKFLYELTKLIKAELIKTRAHRLKEYQLGARLREVICRYQCWKDERDQEVKELCHLDDIVRSQYPEQLNQLEIHHTQAARKLRDQLWSIQDRLKEIASSHSNGQNSAAVGFMECITSIHGEFERGHDVSGCEELDRICEEAKTRTSHHAYQVTQLQEACNELEEAVNRLMTVEAADGMGSVPDPPGQTMLQTPRSPPTD
ncbi:hypothetical protein BDV12DRAFT_204777 [Aspergillus spectabilis]